MHYDKWEMIDVILLTGIKKRLVYWTVLGCLIAMISWLAHLIAPEVAVNHHRLTPAAASGRRDERKEGCNES